jgi:hypothetical protein
MSRPPVSVVMPFAGSRLDAEEALHTLRSLQIGPADELILADNSGLGLHVDGVRVVEASGERSPSHARNVGAELAHGDWVLFLDADCRATPDLLERYFAEPVADDVGALAGEVVPSRDGQLSFAARYGAARSFLGQGAHLSHPYLPRAVAANLLVRRRAFEGVGGFYEGVRAAEDTDFSWRLQRAGWRLLACPEARAEHRYRTRLTDLRQQWRGYAAGRAWLARRYEDFEPQPAFRRAAARTRRRLGVPRGRQASGGVGTSTALTRRPGAARTGAAAPGRLERGGFLALDALLGLDELAGFALSNRPRAREGGQDTIRVVLVAEHFPVQGHPLTDFARTLSDARVEAAHRPEAFDQAAARRLVVRYREDEGLAARQLARLVLVLRHPMRAAFDVFRRGPGQPGLSTLAPAVLRLEADPEARVYALGGDEVKLTAHRLARLAGRRMQTRD